MSTSLEPVDIVNEEDQVVQQTSKQEAHERGLLHRTIIAQVIDSQGRWTLVKQAADRQDEGQYVSPVGGHIQAGESEEDALKREAFEEMGLRDFTYKFVGKGIFNRTILNRLENHYFIVYEIYTDASPILNHESVGFKAFTVEQLKKLLASDPNQLGAAFHFVVQKFYKNLLTKFS